MHGLNVVGMIVPQGAAHAAGTDVVGNDVVVIGKSLFTDPANAVLGKDLPVEEFAHLPIRAQLPVSAGVLRIVDAPDAQMPLTLFLWDCLPATAGEGVMDWTELVSAESHGILLVGRKVMDDWRES